MTKKISELTLNGTPVGTMMVETSNAVVSTKSPISFFLARANHTGPILITDITSFSKAQLATQTTDGTQTYTSDDLSVFAATTSAQLGTLLSDKTGSGINVFATSPALTTPDLGIPSAIDITAATGTLGNVTGLVATTGLTATGTKDATTYLRGDDTWAPIVAEPTGVIKQWGGAWDAPPTGYLVCDGSAISRTTYSDLFGITSTLYGVGDGSSTFNLPSFLDGYMKGAASSTSGGATGGANTVTLTASESGAAVHSHSFSPSSHAHSMGASSNQCASPQSNSTSSTSGNSGNSTNSASAGGSVSNNSGVAASSAHNNEPVYTAVVFIIKT